ncbi:MAG: hypothetical protein RIC93_04760, partial [Alphaproteobacteria bacterium]
SRNQVNAGRGEFFGALQADLVAGALFAHQVGARDHFAENDRLIPNEMADRFAEVIPGANLVSKKGTGHEVCLERPEELTTACIDLISGAAR